MKKELGVKWIRYKLYCYNNGLSEGNFTNLKNFIENNK